MTCPQGSQAEPLSEGIRRRGRFWRETWQSTPGALARIDNPDMTGATHNSYGMNGLFYLQIPSAHYRMDFLLSFVVSRSTF